MIVITESAVKQLQSLLAEQEPGKGLRLYVEHGGCAGLQYGMTIDGPREGDAVEDRDGARVFVDESSGNYLQGSTLDFADGLTGAGFRILNPNAVRSCGCGTSFEPGSAGQEAHASH
jgi:iron-sulfur cluster assembly accessory protein